MTSKRGKKYCSVFGCLNNDFANPDLSFFILPTQPEIRLQWLRLIDREDFSNKSKHNERICEVHFKAEDISMNSQRKRLKKNCLPCLRLPKNKEDKGTHVEITSVTTSTQIDLPSCSSSCQTEKISRSESTDEESSVRLPAEDNDEIKVFCPKCDTEVSHTAEGIQNDQIKIIIAKVYHYFEQEYEELEKTYEGLELTPLSKFGQRTALATGVSESTVLEILQKEKRRNADEPNVKLRVRRNVRKRSRQTDSSSEEDSIESDADDDEQSSTDHVTETLVVKEEPLETFNEEPEIYTELLNVKDEPGVSGANEELADPLFADVKTEPQNKEATNSNQTRAVQPAFKRYKGRIQRRNAEATPGTSAATGPSDPPTTRRRDSNETHAVQPSSKRYKGRTRGRNAEKPPGPSAPPGTSAPPGPSAPPGASAHLSHETRTKEDGKVKVEDIDLEEEVIS